jgi:hypothetical protein
MTPDAMKRGGGSEGRPRIDVHDELVLLCKTLVGRPAGVKLAGIVVLAGVLALLASPDAAHHSSMEGRHPLKLGLLQPSVSAAAQDPCRAPQKSEETSPSP